MSVLAGFSLPTTLIAQSAPRQPNVVIIVADDLGYGDLSCYGAHRIQTPGMDRIANEGIRFTQGYCTAATSTPSRYSLLTGLYPWTNREAKILPGNAALIINTQQVTLPKVMKQAGYVTGSVGKFIPERKRSVTTILLSKLLPMTGFPVSLSRMGEV